MLANDYYNPTESSIHLHLYIHKLLTTLTFKHTLMYEHAYTHSCILLLPITRSNKNFGPEELQANIHLKKNVNTDVDIMYM